MDQETKNALTNARNACSMPVGHYVSLSKDASVPDAVVDYTEKFLTRARRRDFHQSGRIEMHWVDGEWRLYAVR